MNERLGFVLEVEAGLEERSRAPRYRPHAMGKETAMEILRVRRRHPDWGPIS